MSKVKKKNSSSSGSDGNVRSPNTTASTSYVLDDKNKEIQEVNAPWAEYFKGKLDDFEEKFKQAKKDLENSEKETRSYIESNRIKTIESLGIFVALFTFISIEFQIFKVYTHPYSIVGVSLIFLGSLLLMISVLDFLLNFKESDRGVQLNKAINKPKFLIALAWFLIIIFGGFFLCITPEKQNIEEVLSKIDNNSNQEIQVNELINKSAQFEKQQNVDKQKNEHTEAVINCLKNIGYFSKKCFE